MHTLGATNNMPNTSHMAVITLCMTSLFLHCCYYGTSAQRHSERSEESGNYEPFQAHTSSLSCATFTIIYNSTLLHSLW
ncbi:MAG: hypothetical protein IJW31_10205 [Lentisphaeria bacterium]|nr:hypothetical protein [Lentisphaeria bacterium]